MSRPCTLYRFFDTGGRLLYVGITIKPWQRFASHKANKPWWFDAERIHLEHYPSEREAREAETRAIHNEKPLFNSMSQRASGPWPWDFEVILRADPEIAAVVAEAQLLVGCPYCDGRWRNWQALVRSRIGTQRGDELFGQRAGETKSTRESLDELLGAFEIHYGNLSQLSSIDLFLSVPGTDSWFLAVLDGLTVGCDSCEAHQTWRRTEA